MIETSLNVPTISRKDLLEYGNSLVVVCSAALESVENMFGRNVWMYLSISRKPEYLALYVKWPVSKILYIAKVKEILDPSGSPYPNTVAEALRQKIILLEEGSIRKLDPPIKPLPGDRGAIPQARRYTTTEKLARAEHIGDLWK